MTLKTIGSLLGVALMAGCAVNSASPNRMPTMEKNRASTQYQGQLICPDCPTGTVTLTLMEAMPLDPPRYRLQESNDNEIQGTVFEMEGSQQHPNQTLYQLVAPISQNIMTLLPREDGNLRILQYRGMSLENRNIIFHRLQP